MSHHPRFFDKLNKSIAKSKRPERQRYGDTSPQPVLATTLSLSVLETYDPWIEGDRFLRNDPKTKEILENATKVLQRNGLDFDLSEAQNNQQLCRFLEDGARNLEE